MSSSGLRLIRQSGRGFDWAFLLYSLHLYFPRLVVVHYVSEAEDSAPISCTMHLHARHIRWTTATMLCRCICLRWLVAYIFKPLFQFIRCLLCVNTWSYWAIWLSTTQQRTSSMIILSSFKSKIHLKYISNWKLCKLGQQVNSVSVVYNLGILHQVFWESLDCNIWTPAFESS